ncbi:MAG TPA: hypothetical protein VFQ24_01950 [Terriglobia bacterium]|nr:hypothetical protein [Terriglobia bacterium]
MKNRRWRRATIWLLAVMQLHLLMVLVLHHHVLREIALEFSQARTTLGQTEKPSLPAGAEHGFCTACQILRHSAVRPSLGSPAPHRSSLAPFLAPRFAAVVLSTQTPPWHGRAPPLA